MFESLYHLGIYPYHPELNHFDSEQVVYKSSVGCKVKDLVELDDTEQVDNTGWSEVEHWLCLLNG